MKRAFIGLSVAIATYEVCALENREDGDTISERVWAASKYPLVPFLAGMIAGHFFWQRRP
jgi:hypothetical protein